MRVDPRRMRERMVDEQIVARGISDARVISVMRELPRHLFVEEAMAKQAPRLRELDEAPGLTADQLKLRQQLKIFMDEQQAAIAHSERALKDIENILTRLRQAKETTARAAADWQAFLAAEKVEVAETGGTTHYVTEKLEQVKGDDARPRQDRLAYARRLQKLDPANKDVLRLVNGLLGKEEEPAAPKPANKKKAPAKK